MELVAPAGNLEKLEYAYAYGADAAYIGLKQFSLRIKADNFYGDEFRRIKFLKTLFPKKKLFCALNISFHNKEIDALINEIDYFKSYPFDAFIIQDIGLVPLLQKHFPSAALHLSTQANCINREAVKMYQSMGFHRIVLGRETSLDEIREIKDAIPLMELEIFAHGAMCIAYSGRCLMSAYMSRRSANGGFCSHSCRWNYNLQASAKQLAESGSLALQEKERPDEYFPVFEGENFTALLSSKDLCMVRNLADLKKAGADSLKIEGRMKSLYYVALTARAYRKAVDALDGKCSPAEAEPFIAELYKIKHRAFSTGFFYGQDDANQTTAGESSSDYEMAGTIAANLGDAVSLFAAGLSTEQEFLNGLKNQHPNARKAKEQDLSLHPEKICRPVRQKLGWKFYEYRAMNKLKAKTPIECIAPDIVSIPLSGEDYELVHPESGILMDWVSHGHSCLLYTPALLKENWIVRVKIV